MRKVVTGFSLAILVAALGCTTNNNPGNGQPTNAPATMPSSPPMASSSLTPMTPSERAAASVDAFAILAAEQGYRGRVLGPANPAAVAVGPNSAPAIVEPINPAPIVNPGTTVNSSITSPATPAITGGTAGGGVAADSGALFSAAATVGATTVATNGAAVRTQAAIPAASATTPIAGTATRMANPAGTATVPAVPPATATTVVNTGTTATATVAPATVAPATTTATDRAGLRLPARATTRTAAARTTTTNAAPVRIETNTNGDIMVTNAKATSSKQ